MADTRRNSTMLHRTMCLSNLAPDDGGGLASLAQSLRGRFARVVELEGERLRR